MADENQIHDDVPTVVGTTQAEAVVLEKSPTLGKLFAALAKAQKDFKTPVKDQVVDFTFNGKRTYYKFANLASIIKTNQDAMAKNGLCITQVKNMRGNNFGLTTILGHESGEYISSYCPLPTPIGKKPQDYGAFLTYMRRYSYASIQGVESDQDDDGQTLNPDSKGNPPANQQKRGAKASKSSGGTNKGGQASKANTGQNPPPRQPDPEDAKESQTKVNAAAIKEAWDLMQSKGFNKEEAQQLCKKMFNKPSTELNYAELAILKRGVEAQGKELLNG